MSQGRGQFGSMGGFPNGLQGMNTTTYGANTNPVFQNAASSALGRMGLMPRFGRTAPGAFGGGGSAISYPGGPSIPGAGEAPPTTPGGDPAWVFGKGPSSFAPMNPTGGMSPVPQKSVGFSVNQGVNKPAMMPQTGGMSPIPQQPMPTQVPGANPMLAQNYASVAGFQMPQMPSTAAETTVNPAYQGQQPSVAKSIGTPAAPGPQTMNTPWGNFSLASMGPSYHQVGSPLGGYFQNGRYTPNAGNAMNGMDTLARFGLDHTGMAFGPIGAR